MRDGNKRRRIDFEQKRAIVPPHSKPVFSAAHAGADLWCRRASPARLAARSQTRSGIGTALARAERAFLSSGVVPCGLARTEPPRAPRLQYLTTS
jgi:hypothetical protein